MPRWNSDELHRIGAADELQVAPLRPDGTLRDPATIWVVAVEGHLYVRSAYSGNAAWWRAARRAGRGRIRAAGIDRGVAFLDAANDEHGDAIDATYRAKYHRYSPNLVNTIVAPDARATTLELVPQ